MCHMYMQNTACHHLRSCGGASALPAVKANDVIEFLVNEPRLSKLVDFHYKHCPISGYFPLHAAVANGRVYTYDLLVLHGADQHLHTATSAAAKQMHLTPLQLAVRLGQKNMLEHILNRRRQVPPSPARTRTLPRRERRAPAAQRTAADGPLARERWR